MLATSVELICHPAAPKKKSTVALGTSFIPPIVSLHVCVSRFLRHSAGTTKAIRTAREEPSEGQRVVGWMVSDWVEG